MREQLKMRVAIIAGVVMTVCLLAGAASARRGGIPACVADLGDVTANLEAVTTDLGTCDEDLTTCEEDFLAIDGELDLCRESQGVILPGDGEGNGADLAYEACADGLTAADLNTGLLWERKVRVGNSDCLLDLHAEQSGCSWAEATGQWLDAVNAEGGTGFAGFSDWRVPNVKDLLGIVDYSESLPAIDPTFPGETLPDVYWSATPLPGSSPPEAWIVNFDGGTVFVDFQSDSRQVRAVRNGPCPTP